MGRWDGPTQHFDGPGFAAALNEAAAVARGRRAARDLERALERSAASLARGMDGMADSLRIMREAARPQSAGARSPK